MNESTTDSSDDSNLREERPESTSPTKPAGVQTLEEWGDKMCRMMEELHRNEALRREIARRLS